MYTENSIIELEKKAINAAKEVHSVKNPPPLPPSLKKDLSSIGQLLLVILALFAMVVAAVIISASHMIPLFIDSVHVEKGWEWVKTVVGIAAVVMCELGAIVIAYYMVMIKPEDYKAAELRKLLYPVVGLLLVIMVSGNLYSTYENYYMDESATAVEPVSPTNASLVAFTTSTNEKELPFLAKVAKALITALIGISAPSIAFSVGEILAIVLVREQGKSVAKLESYKRDYAAWQQKEAEYVDATKGQWIVKLKKEMAYKLPVIPQVELLARPVTPERKPLEPIRIVENDKTKYQCPECSKTMTRQAWQNHPCRFTKDDKMDT